MLKNIAVILGSHQKNRREKNIGIIIIIIIIVTIIIIIIISTTCTTGAFHKGSYSHPKALQNHTHHPHNATCAHGTSSCCLELRGTARAGRYLKRSQQVTRVEVSWRRSATHDQRQHDRKLIEEL
jgi:hypothetical protein